MHSTLLATPSASGKPMMFKMSRGSGAGLGKPKPQPKAPQVFKFTESLIKQVDVMRVTTNHFTDSNKQGVQQSPGVKASSKLRQQLAPYQVPTKLPNMNL